MKERQESTARSAEVRTARLFRNGHNQAVRLPRDYETDAEEVFIRRDGNKLIITPKPRSWEAYFENARRLTDDFPDALEDLPLQTREPL